MNGQGQPVSSSTVYPPHSPYNLLTPPPSHMGGNFSANGNVIASPLPISGSMDSMLLNIENIMKNIFGNSVDIVTSGKAKGSLFGPSVNCSLTVGFKNLQWAEQSLQSRMTPAPITYVQDSRVVELENRISQLKWEERDRDHRLLHEVEIKYAKIFSQAEQKWFEERQRLEGSLKNYETQWASDRDRLNAYQHSHQTLSEQIESLKRDKASLESQLSNERSLRNEETQQLSTERSLRTQDVQRLTIQISDLQQQKEKIEKAAREEKTKQDQVIQELRSQVYRLTAEKTNIEQIKATKEAEAVQLEYQLQQQQKKMKEGAEFFNEQLKAREQIVSKAYKKIEERQKDREEEEKFSSELTIKRLENQLEEREKQIEESTRAREELLKNTVSRKEYDKLNAKLHELFSSSLGKKKETEVSTGPSPHDALHDALKKDNEDQDNISAFYRAAKKANPNQPRPQTVLEGVRTLKEFYEEED